MQWLNDWLKTVITIVMFAAFVDLLLPSSKMQRYVKTVLSLFILLTLLSPVLDLFRNDWSVDKLLAEAEQKQQENGKTLVGSNNSLQAITEQGQRLRDSQDQQAMILAEKQLVEAIKESIRTETAYEAEQVLVSTGDDAQGNRYIKSISAVLSDKVIVTEAKPQEDKAKPIASIKPVQIQIRVESKVQKTTASIEQETPEQVQTRADVRKLIGRNWSVPVERIDIKFEVSKRSKLG